MTVPTVACFNVRATLKQSIRWKQAAQLEGYGSAGAWLAVAGDTRLELLHRGNHPIPLAWHRGRFKVRLTNGSEVEVGGLVTTVLGFTSSESDDEPRDAQADRSDSSARYAPGPELESIKRPVRNHERNGSADCGMTPPANSPRLFDWIELGVQAAGVVVLFFYTYYTRQQLKTNQEVLTTMQETLREMRGSNLAAELRQMNPPPR